MSLKLVGPLNTGTTAGGAGVSTANASTTTSVVGLVHSVYVKYNGAPPAGTTDITVKTVGTSPAPPSVTFLTLVNAATDGWFYPRVPAQDNAGTDVTFNGTQEIYIKYAVHDLINVTIAQANDGDSADVWFLLECN